MSDQEFQSQVLQRFDRIDDRLEKVEVHLEKVESRLAKVEVHLEKVETDVKQFDQKFSNYQQAIQWVVQLSFTLIASATVTIIVSSVLRR